MMNSASVWKTDEIKFICKYIYYTYIERYISYTTNPNQIKSISFLVLRLSEIHNHTHTHTHTHNQKEMRKSAKIVFTYFVIILFFLTLVICKYIFSAFKLSPPNCTHAHTHTDTLTLGPTHPITNNFQLFNDIFDQNLPVV